MTWKRERKWGARPGRDRMSAWANVMFLAPSRSAMRGAPAQIVVLGQERLHGLANVARADVARCTPVYAVPERLANGPVHRQEEKLLSRGLVTCPQFARVDWPADDGLLFRSDRPHVL